MRSEDSLIHRKVVLLFALMVALVVVLALAAPAQAATQRAERAEAAWYYDEYDQIVRNISGVGDLRVMMVDGAYDWVYLYGADAETIGFVCLFVSYYDWCYHRIYISPLISPYLGLQGGMIRPWWDLAQNAVYPVFQLTHAVMTVVHEAYHWRLFSGNEGRVEACTVRDLPYWLQHQFRIPPLVQQVQTVPQQVTEHVEESYQVRQKYKKRIWVKRKGKRVGVWVTRYRWVTKYRLVPVTKTVYVQQTVNVPNPVFTNIVNQANAIYAAEPPPYGGGTCY